MDNKYKLVISGKGIYREYVLSDIDSDTVRVGTNKGCQIRFNKRLFFEEFEFRLDKNNNGWQINSKDSVYFTTDGVMKLYSKNLQHGDGVSIKYENLNEVIFNINLFIDFDNVEKKYDRKIQIADKKEVTIGGSSDCNIFIEDNLLMSGCIKILNENNKYIIKDNGTKYGVYVNTIKVNKSQELKNHDFIIILGYYFYFKDEYIFTDKYTNMKLTDIASEDYEYKNKFNYPKFNRSSRVKYIIPEKEIEILQPEKLNKKPKGKLLMTLIPAIIMLAVTVVLRGFMGNGGSFIIFSAISMSMGIIMSIVTAIGNKREYNEEIKERKIKYTQYINEKEENIKKLRHKERLITNKIYIPIEKTIENIEIFDVDLFDRDQNDNDFLTIRLGIGKTKSHCSIKTTQQEFKDVEDELASLPEELAEKYEEIDGVPIISKLSTVGAIGIVGIKNSLRKMLKNITIDIVGRHFYKDIKLFYVLDEKEAVEYTWLKWIKHVYNEELNIRNIIYNEESKNILFEYLYIELLRRSEDTESEKTIYTHMIIFVLDDKGIYNHPISRFIKDAATLNVTFIFFEEFEELLPKGCNEIVRLSKNENEGELVKCFNGEEITKFIYEDIDNIDLEKIALRLAPIYVDEVSLESQLTKNITLFELLGVMSVEDLDISQRWNSSMVYKSMAAPLGVKANSEIVSLDLNEKNHGPHGLVAGTTGSGKSEILQSYILSMATLFHPYEVGFVIIDFKGGGMVNQFKDLPHLNGAITNIDGREITRSLLSIKAELRKRQELFAKYGVNHIDAYIKKFKKNEIKEALPHLILVVDEFAELKSDQPEFMKELISAARIGRSLGVHLILATQKPSGVIDDQIWSNSKFKLCLKVQNQADSKEVLKSPLAAEIKEPGRAYLQVGNNEIFELFQSAYSGATAIKDDINDNREFQINEVNLWGKRTPIFTKKKAKSNGSSESQLEVIVEYINQYCKDNNIEKLQGICLPPLPNLIRLSEVDTAEKNELSIEVSIGMYDDPTQQLQAPVKLNISEGNLFIIGSSQYGKTSLLQTIIRTIAESYSPKEVNIYALDFASMILKNFEKLKHVGGVITSSDDEKLKTFMKMMTKEIEIRKSLLSDLGISSFASYKEAGYKDIPQIVIILDNMTAFKELYPERDEEFLNLCREGIAVGISIIISNAQTSGIGYKYMSNFQNRIALYCNDSGEYSSLFDRCRMSPKNVPGRALISIDKIMYEYQNYLAFDGEKEIDRVNSMREFIKENSSIYPDVKAKIIPEIPKNLNMEYLEENYKKVKYQPYEIPIGLNYEDINVETIDLTKEVTLVLKGKENTGKSTFIHNIINNIQKNIINNEASVYVVDNIEKKLNFVNEYGFVEKYTSLASSLEILIEEIHEKLEERSENIKEFGVKYLEKEPLILLINNNRDALNTLASNKSSMEKYKEIVNKYKKMKICIIFNDIEDVQVGFSSLEILKLLKENKNAILFDQLDENKIYDIPMNIVKKFKKPLELGDVYKFKGGEIEKIKTVYIN